MKKLILMTILCMVSLAGLAPGRKVLYIPAGTPIRPYEALWRAVCIVESQNDPLAYNPQEQATGICQIRPIRLRDYNHRAHKSYKMHDLYDPIISKEIFMHYAKRYHHTDYETIARAWNGKGHKTIIYWNKVKKQINAK